MAEEKGAHQRPSQARTMRNCRVHLRCIHRPDVDEVNRLAPEGGLKPVGGVAEQLLTDSDGDLAKRLVEASGAVDRVFGGDFPSHNLDQWHDVRRVEWVTDQYPFWMAALALKKRRAEAGRARGQDDVTRCNGIHSPVSLSLDFLTLRTVLLNEVRFGDAFLDRCHESDPRLARARRQAHSIEHRPCGSDRVT